MYLIEFSVEDPHMCLFRCTLTHPSAASFRSLVGTIAFHHFQSLASCENFLPDAEVIRVESWWMSVLRASYESSKSYKIESSNFVLLLASQIERSVVLACEQRVVKGPPCGLFWFFLRGGLEEIGNHMVCGVSIKSGVFEGEGLVTY